jgi:hypothetical protein
MTIRTDKFTVDDLLYALGNAAEFLELEQFPHDDGTDTEGQQEAANREAAKRIRRMAHRYMRKHSTTKVGD